jgi:peptidoglycan/xylan/chitin deacetylase (PgdA/CDA1 family)
MLNKNQVNYTLDTLISTLGINPNIPISHGYKLERNGINILCSDEIENIENEIGRKNISSLPNYIVLEDKTPLLYSYLSLDIGEPLIHYENRDIAVSYDSEKNVVYIGFDLIASAFYFLSLMEEDLPHKLEEHNRFLAQHGQLSSRFGVHPVVNSYLRILFKTVHFLHDKMNLPVVQKWYWPGGKDFAVCLTHDIDFLKPGMLYNLLLPIKRFLHLDLRGTISALKRWPSLISGKPINPWEYKKMVDIENGLGVKSTFFFMTGGRNKHDYPYNIEKMGEELAELKNTGFELGLHGSYDSYKNEEMLEEERRKLEKVVGIVTGARQHYLRFDSDTWVKQENAGFSYDTTLCYADAPGFRGGLAYPYYPYNHDTGKKMNILEIPLTLMDKTLSDHMKMDINEAWGAIKNIIKTVEGYNGLMTLLWHNERFDDVAFPGWSELYKKVLEDLKEKSSWITKAGNVHSWWLSRQNLVCEDVKAEGQNMEIIYRAGSNVENMTFYVYNLKSKECAVKCKGKASIVKKDIVYMNIDRIEKGEIIGLEIAK